jgi:23S rRNA pseudouridine1911/1915/1917 synthase
MKTTYTVEPEDGGRRLDLVLARLTERTRSWCQQQIKAGRVRVHGTPLKPNSIVETGDNIELKLPEVKEFPAPELPVVYEDNDLLIVDKPAGVLAHANEGIQRAPSVADFARSRVKDSDTSRPGIVHRLDRDTSGLMIIAKHPKAKQYLQDLFRSQGVTKTYQALVVGRLRPDKAKIELPIGRSQRSRAKQAPRPGGRAAVTTYTVLAEYPGLSLVEIKPETGRTHQIRVHMSAIGHPLVGDGFYGKPDTSLKRHFLHASQLSFIAPSGKPVDLESPLPQDLANYLARIKTV